MTREDYTKNTRLPGVPKEVLDVSYILLLREYSTANISCLQYFFDNVVFAPFIFIEDPVDVNGQFGLTPDVTRTTIYSPTSVISANSSMTFKIGNKVDPYYLIVNVCQIAFPS